MNSSLFPVLLGLAAAGIVAWLVVMIVRYARRRKALLAQFAAERGLEFEPRLPVSLSREFSSRAYFEQSGDCSNLLSGGELGGEVLFFDQSYEVWCGETPAQSYQTAAAFRLPSPEFSVRKRGFLDRMWMNGLKTDSVPGGWKALRGEYVMRAPDWPAAQALVSPAVMDWLEARPEWVMAGKGNWVVAYRPDRMVPPAEYAAFIEEAKGLGVLLAPKR